MSKNLPNLCFSLLYLSFLLAACASPVPATKPAQLSASPAAAEITITNELVDAGRFRVNYPDAWRVVKLSLAGEPIHLVFASPDNGETFIEISEDPMIIPESTLDPNLYERWDKVEIGINALYMRGQSLRENQAEFDLIYEAVMDSIVFP